MLSFNIDDARRAIRALATEANPLAAWIGWPEFDRPLMLVGKAESIQLLLAQEPQDRGELAARLYREAIGEAFDEANNDIAPEGDWRDVLFQKDWDTLRDLEGPRYCVWRAVSCAAVALTYVLEAREMQLASRELRADVGLLMLRALEASTLADAALSWRDVLESQVNKLSFEEHARLNGVKKDLRDSEWYRLSYPARRRREITLRPWLPPRVDDIRATVDALASHYQRKTAKVLASAGGRGRHAATNRLKAQAIEWLKAHYREYRSTSQAAGAFLDSLPDELRITRKVVEGCFSTFLKQSPEYRPSRRLVRTRK